MKKTIAVVYSGRFGGGNLDAFEAAKSYINNGNDVIGVVSSELENLWQWKLLPIKKLIIVKTYNSKISFFYRTLLFFLYGRYKVRKLLYKYDVDYIYCPAQALWTGMLIAICKKIPSAVVNHDPQRHSGEENKIVQYLYDIALKNADVILVHTKRFVDLVYSLYKKPTYYVPLGRHNIYKYIKNKKIIVKYEEKKINYVFFGRISPYKGLDDLAKAYKKIAEEREDVRLTVIGGGDFSAYNSLYKDLPNVRIINRWIMDEEVDSCFNSSAKLINILPYKDATQSGVALVAMDYGIPVIATNVGGLSEQIQNHITGILIEPKNIQQLYEAMRKLAEDSDLYYKYSQNSKARVQKLSWDNTMMIVNEIMSKVSNNRSRY